MSNSSQNKRPNDNQRPRMPKGGGFLKRSPLSWFYMILLFIILGIFFFPSRNTPREIEWSKFQALMERDAFTEIQVFSDKGYATGVISSDRKAVLDSVGLKNLNNDRGRKTLLGSTSVTAQIPSPTAVNDLYQELNKSDKPISAKVSYDNKRDSLFMILINIVPFLLIIVFWIWMMRRMNPGGGAGGGGGGIFNVGKSKAQLFDKENRVKVTFRDVAGLSEAKQEVEEIVHFLREPESYTHLGGKIPKGALLVGPPGTGKTLLAKAVAGEANVPFFSLSGSDFVEMFVGVGASRVRDLFKTAKEKAPCIVFIDEIDAVGRARGKNAGFGGNDERENTLNQLLTEMDGFDTNSGVIILAATNRVDILDKALLRAGRFDRQIHVDLPDLNERKEIFHVHMRRLKLSNAIDVDLLARQTPGFSGADIANVCNEAALIAARHKKSEIEPSDFMNAVDRIIGGLEKKSRITTTEEKKAISIHEAGHATISWLLEHANPLIKVTIVPRGRALGAAWYLPEERPITTTEQLLDEMCAIMGGRAAEELCLGRISTGAANDLQRATRMAQAMVTYFGMSSTLPNINYEDPQNEYGFTKPYSEETAKLIDKEVLKIINEQYERAKRILNEHKDGHEQIANLLFEKEVIYTHDVEEVLGKRPWKSRADELMELEKKRKIDHDELQKGSNASKDGDTSEPRDGENTNRNNDSVFHNPEVKA